MEEIRVRFAPSPTGPLHIGGVRTALYNYLFARKNGGKVLLRIEDTDQTRFVQGAEEYIIKSLNWLGIEFDEGVHVGGEYGPYRQSDRKDIYKKYVDILLENNWAYYAFDSAESLDAIRKQYEAEKKVFQYDANTRLSMLNSLTMSKEEVESKLAENAHYVVRFKFPQNIDIEVNDLIRGRVVMNSNQLDDKVLYKSDGMPTYHLANIVDDHLMKISHVIRGEEWLPSAPLHVMLYKAFDWETPQFAHLPLLLKPDGNGKLSKRDGDRLGFPVFPMDWTDPKNGSFSHGYKEWGYFPEAVINFLSLLGWNPGNDKEIMSMNEIIDLFSLERVNKSGAKFDIEKCKWFNHHYLQEKSNKELACLFMETLRTNKVEVELSYVETLCGLLKDRVSFVQDLWNESYFFFKAPTEYDQTVVKKRWKENSSNILKELSETLSLLEDFSIESIDKTCHGFAENKEYGIGQVMIPFRIALVGAAKGPDIATIASLLGKEETLSRISKAIQVLG